MMNHLTVAQNIFIGREMMKSKFIDDNKMNIEAKKLFDKLNIDINPNDIMGDLTVGKQQMCEIAKAISQEAEVIVFDEPTAALTDSEIEELFKIIKDLKSKGIGIIYISHRMDEIKLCEICESNHLVETHHIIKRKQAKYLENCKLNLINLCWIITKVLMEFTENMDMHWTRN